MYKQILFLLLAVMVVLLGGWYWKTTTLPEAIEPDNTTAVYLEELTATDTSNPATTSDLYSIFEPLLPMQIGEKEVQASLAVTPEERRLGLSNTPALPADVVKVFVFPESKQWSFWMKDMNYAIDIIWVDQSGTIVHIASDVSPESYPESFKSPQSARYVIETVAGFTDEHAITVGTSVNLPEKL